MKANRGHRHCRQHYDDPQLAKAAIRAGIELLLRSYGADSRWTIAGGIKGQVYYGGQQFPCRGGKICRGPGVWPESIQAGIYFKKIRKYNTA